MYTLSAFVVTGQPVIESLVHPSTELSDSLLLVVCRSRDVDISQSSTCLSPTSPLYRYISSKTSRAPSWTPSRTDHGEMSSCRIHLNVSGIRQTRPFVSTLCASPGQNWRCAVNEPQTRETCFPVTAPVELATTGELRSSLSS